MIRLSAAAQACVDETGCNPEADAEAIRAGRHTPESLLAHCLDGADPDRVQGWLEYVAAIAEAASR